MQAIADNMHFTLPDFMASSNGRKSDNQRPRPLHTSRSFSRIEAASPKPSTRSQRASTIQNGVITEDAMSEVSNDSNKKRGGDQADAFEKSSDDESPEAADEGNGKLRSDFDELPIELISLTDRSVKISLGFHSILICMQLYRFALC
jgi:hypothetical protein